MWYALLTCTAPFEATRRYVTGGGSYPWNLTIRTPIGSLPITVDEHQDLLTVNEIFFRRDYGSASHRTVVDIGANVGYATLFFLTRTRACHVWALEPDPATAGRFRKNTAAFADRVTLLECAATSKADAPVSFARGWHSRYGRVAAAGDGDIVVEGVEISALLKEITAETGGPVDLVKIDTEGTEPELVAAIPAGVAREVRYEMPGHVLVRRDEVAEERP